MYRLCAKPSTFDCLSTPFPGSLSTMSGSSVTVLKGVPASKFCIYVHLLYANSIVNNPIVSVESYEYSIGAIVAG